MAFVAWPFVSTSGAAIMYSSVLYVPSFAPAPSRLSFDVPIVSLICINYEVVEEGQISTKKVLRNTFNFFYLAISGHCFAIFIMI